MTHLEKSDLDDLRDTMNRIVFYFLTFFKWISVMLGINRDTKLVVVIKDAREEYLSKHKIAFLNTFSSADASRWNDNLDKVFYDQSALSEIMKDSSNELEKKWKRSVLIECTPRGNVFMFYDMYKQAFSYYCDKAIMPYDLMNAVAMKYVLTFHCRDLFVDNTVLPKKDAPEDKNAVGAEPKKSIEKTDQPFAKFKSYNNATNKTNTKKLEDKIINRFLHLGPVRNWSPVIKPVKFNPINGFKTDMIPSNTKLSYQEYKRLQLK